MKQLKCAECGQPLTSNDTWVREGDDGPEYVCGECVWEPAPQDIPVCAKGDSCPLAQIVADFIRRLEEEEAWQSGDAETNEMQAIREARDWPACLWKGAGQ